MHGLSWECDLSKAQYVFAIFFFIFLLRDQTFCTAFELDYKIHIQGEMSLPGLESNLDITYPIEYALIQIIHCIIVSTSPCLRNQSRNYPRTPDWKRGNFVTPEAHNFISL